MTAKKKISARVMAMLLAVVLILSAFPMSAFAAVASDLPDEMADHAILRALEYTGYDVSAFIRDYLSVKQSAIPQISRVYYTFKYI